MSTIEEYAKTAVIERTEEDNKPSDQPTARISFGTFVLRVPDTRND